MPDFFDNPKKVKTDAPLFGLCDDSAPTGHVKAPATLEVADMPQAHWLATVHNDGRKTVGFYPIDNCMRFVRPDGSEDEICDAMLHYDVNRLKFVELKDRDYSHKWFAKAASQLKTTIAYFLKSHPDSDRYIISAHISNPRRPSAAVSCKVAMAQFADQTGVPIDVASNIIL